jgi:ATP:ADP antiporter, AAA family
MAEPANAATRGPGLRVVVWGAATFACLLAATFVIRPVRDTLVIDGKPELLPALFTGTFIATLVLAPVWGWLIARFRRRAFLAISYTAIAVVLAGFALAVQSPALDPRVLAKIFYVFAAVANIFLVSVFWSVCADMLGPETARKLYGPIAVGGTIGAVVGPLLTKLLVRTLEVGTSGVLVAAAVLVLLALAGVQRLAVAARALADTAEARGDTAVEGGKLDGLRDVARSPYLGGAAIYVVFTACLATFVYLLQADIVYRAIPDRAAQTDYFATVDLYTNVGVLVVQSVLAGWLLGWVGVGVVLCALPLLQGAGAIALYATPTLGVLVAVQVATRIAQHGLTRPARELLFTVVSRDQKYRAKNVIDTLLFRMGDVGSAWLYVGIGAAGLGHGAVLAVALAVVAAWIATALLLDVGFRRRRALARC